MPERLRLSRQARIDLIEIWQHIAENSSAAADRVLRRVDAANRRLAGNPQLGVARSDLRAELRKWRVGEYLILYRTIPKGVEIVRVIHGRRDLTKLFP